MTARAGGPRPTADATRSPSSDALTILVPTRNRPEMLQRLLRYFEACAVPWPIVVLDASEKQRRARTDTTRLRVEHRTYRPSSKVPPRLLDGLRHVRTPYTVVCGDDDGLLPEGLRAAAEFLDSHAGHVVARGHALVFKQEASGIRWFNYPQASVEHDDPAARVRWHLAFYTTSWYSLTRTGVLAEAIRAGTAGGEDLSMFELLWSAVSVAHGKFRSLDVPFMVREMHDSSEGAVFTPIIEQPVHPGFGAQARAFVRLVAEALQQAGVPGQEAAQAAHDALVAYLGQRFGALRKHGTGVDTTKPDLVTAMFHAVQRDLTGTFTALGYVTQLATRLQHDLVFSQSKFYEVPPVPAGVSAASATALLDAARALMKGGSPAADASKVRTAPADGSSRGTP